LGRLSVRPFPAVARLRELAIDPWLEENPGWSARVVAEGARSATLALAGPGGGFTLRVEPAGEPGGAAHTGRCLRVIAIGVPEAAAAFDDCARRLVAIEEGEPAAETPRTTQRIPEGGTLTHPERTARDFHLIALGLPRTGTTTLAAMFPRRRCAHELWCGPVCDALVERRDLRPILAERERIGRLEVDVTSFLWAAAELVVGMFPEAVYVQTWRPFPGWLDSWIGLLGAEAPALTNGTLLAEHRGMLALHSTGCDPRWFTTERDVRQNLAEIAARGLALWTEANTRVLAALPADALVIRTDELASAGPRLTARLGIAADEVEPRHHNAAGVPVGAWAALPDATRRELEDAAAPLEARLTARSRASAAAI
jgi:hypothetical protein